MAKQGETSRSDILRGVYEENRRMGDPAIPTPRPRRARTYATGAGGVILMLIALALAVDYVFQDAGSRSVARGPEEAAASLLNTPSVTGILPSRTIPVLSDSFATADESDSLHAFEAIASAPVPLAELFDLGVRTVVIDAGHGGRDPGALGSGGLPEKEITLDVALRLRRRLEENHHLKVLLTRDDDQTRSLKERVEFTNRAGADLFVSVHVNEFPEEPVYALETYYFGPHRTASELRLAERENRNSDYAVADFNDMIRQIGDRVKLEESRRLAHHVQRSLFRNTRKLNGQVSDWGVKTAPFVVLVGARVPGILSEIGVISNSEEEARLRKPEYRENLALFLEEGIVTYLNELSETRATQNGVTEYATEKDLEN